MLTDSYLTLKYYLLSVNLLLLLLILLSLTSEDVPLCACSSNCDGISQTTVVLLYVRYLQLGRSIVHGYSACLHRPAA